MSVTVGGFVMLCLTTSRFLRSGSSKRNGAKRAGSCQKSHNSHRYGWRHSKRLIPRGESLHEDMKLHVGL